jgi:hypothetical protein
MLQHVLKPLENSLDNKIVCFKTLWDTFLVNSHPDLSHPYWNSFHPYLLHPFLDLDAVEYLNSLNILGIATDTPGIDCPLYDVVDRFSIPELIQLRNAVFSGKSPLINLAPDKRFRLVHHSFLSMSKHYIKNLHFPDIVCSTGSEHAVKSDFTRISKSDITRISKFLFPISETWKEAISTETGFMIVIPISVKHIVMDAILLKVVYVQHRDTYNDIL